MTSVVSFACPHETSCFAQEILCHWLCQWIPAWAVWSIERGRVRNTWHMWYQTCIKWMWEPAYEQLKQCFLWLFPWLLFFELSGQSALIPKPAMLWFRMISVEVTYVCLQCLANIDRHEVFVLSKEVHHHFHGFDTWQTHQTPFARSWIPISSITPGMMPSITSSRSGCGPPAFHGKIRWNHWSWTHGCAPQTLKCRSLGALKVG